MINRREFLALIATSAAASAFGTEAAELTVYLEPT